MRYFPLTFIESYYEIIRMVSAILRQVEGDCFWSSTGYFVPLLIRKEGQVIIDPTLWGLGWDERGRQALSVPFTTGKLPYDWNR